MNTPQIRSLVNRVANKISIPSEGNTSSEVKSRALVIESLEPRILFSGSPAPAPEPAPAQESTAQEAPATSPAPSEAAPAEGEPNVATAPESQPEPSTEPGGATAIALTQEQVAALSEAAVQKWVESGISADQAAALQSVSYSIGDIGGRHLGSATGSSIQIDDNGGGAGWFIDDSPFDDSEFSEGSVTGVDLLSVILHEQGHVLGLDDNVGTGGVMDQNFDPRERRLPGVGEAAGATAGSVEGTHFATLTSPELLVWLRADQIDQTGNTVDNWNDLTGLFNLGDGTSQDAALFFGGPTSTPGNTANGQPAVEFGGGGGYRFSGTVGFSPGDDITLFVVGRTDSNAAQRIVQVGDQAGPNLGEIVAFDIGTPATRYNNGNNIFNAAGNWDANIRISEFSIADGGNYNSSTLALDGTNIAATGSTNPGFVTTVSGANDLGYTLGNGTNNGGANNEILDGRVAEMFLFNGPLTADDRNAIGAYLESRYSLTTAYAPPGTTTLASVIAPDVVYVDDDFTGSEGDVIADADLGTTGNQGALFGINAFSNITDALAAVSANGTIIVNDGTYAESVALDNTRTLEITGPDAVQNVAINALSSISGTTVNIEGGSILTIGDGTNTTLTSLIMGSGSLVKAGAGTVTLNSTAANTFTGGTTINGGILSLGTGGTGGDTSHVDALGTGDVTVNSGSELRLWIRNNAAFTIDNNLNLNGGTVHNEDGNYTLSGNVALTTANSTVSAKWGGKDLRLTGVISGAGALNVQNVHSDNGGAVYVNGTVANTYSGGTNVSNTFLSLGTGGTGAETSHQDALGTGTVTINANADVRLWIRNQNTYTFDNDFALNGGVLHAEDGNYNVTGDVDVTAGSIVSARWTNKDLTISGVVSGAGTLNVQNVNGNNGGKVVIDTPGNNANSGFTGDITVGNGTLQSGSSGQRINILGGGAKTITVNNGGTLRFSSNDAFGNAGSNPTNTIVINQGGTVTTANSFTVLNDIQLNGGTLATNGGANANFQALYIRGDITVGGAVASTITSAGGNQGIHLSAGTVFDVANVVAGGDLVANAFFINQTGTQGGAAGGIVKTGAGDLYLGNSGSTFSGNLDIQAGTVRATAGHNNQNNTSALGTAIANRTITVGNGTTLEFSANDVFGNASSSPTANIVVDGGTVTNTGNFFNTLGPLTLNGGNLNAVGGANASFQAWRLFGDVTVGGTTASSITSTGANSGVQLNGTTTFTVADVTGDTATDLLVSAPLVNQTPQQGGGPANLVKNGAGTMALNAAGNSMNEVTSDGGVLSFEGASTTNIAGNLRVGDTVTGNVRIQDTADVTVAAELLVGDSGGVAGNVTQSGGSLTVNNRVRLAHWGGEVSTYDISAGTLNVTNALNVGWDGSGVFTQSGGTVNTGQLIVDGSGLTGPNAGQNDELNISGGQLNTNFFGDGGGLTNISGSADVNVNGNLFLGQGNGRSGAISQTGGVVDVSGEIRVGHWANETSTYDLSAGTLNSNGTLYVGWDGMGDMNVSGTGDLNAGTVVVQHDSDLSIADNATVDTTFLSIGDFRGAGNVTQTGGTLTANGEVRIGNSVNGPNSQYNISGGLLDANNILSVGWDGANSSLNVSGTGDVDAGIVLVQNNSTLSIADSATVDGTFFSIGDQSGTGFVDQTGGTLTSTGSVRIGHWTAGANSNYDISGGALNAANLQVGWDGTNAALNATGTGDVNIAGTVIVQREANLNISDNSTFDAANLSMGDQRGAGTITQDGGATTFTNVVRIGHWNSGTSTYNMNGGTLDLTGTSGGGGEQPGILTLGVDGTGNFVQAGGDVTAEGIVLDARGDTGSGIDTLTLNGGTMTLGQHGIASANPSIQVNLGGGTLAASANWNSALDMAVTGTGGPITFDTNGLVITMDGVLAGAGGLTKVDAGTLDLNGQNDYQGSTLVTGGTFSLTDGQIYTNNAWVNRSMIFTGGSVVEVGGWADGDTNTSQAGLGRVGFGSGNILVDNATIRYTGNSTTGRSDRGFTIGAGGATLEAEGGNDFLLTNDRGFGVVANAGGTLTLSGSQNGELNHNLTSNAGVVKRGTGTWDITGQNSVTSVLADGGVLSFEGTSSTTISGGLTVGDTAAASVEFRDSTTVDIGGSFSIGDSFGVPGSVLHNSGDVTVAGGFRLGHWPNETSTYEMNAGTLELTGTAGGQEGNGTLTIGVDGTGQFTQNGGTITAERLHLNSRNNGQGGTSTFDMTGGELQLRDQGITGNISGGSNYQLNLGGGTLTALDDFAVAIPATLTGTNGSTTVDTGAFNVTVADVLSGPGGLDKIGSGNLIINGAGTFTGTTNVNAGTLAGTGGVGGTLNVALGATYDPGADPAGNTSGQFETGGFIGTIGANFNVDLNGGAPGSGYDQTVVAGTVDIGGATLNLANVTGYEATSGDMIVLIDNDGTDAVSGTFAGLAEGAVVDDVLSQNVFIITYQGGDGNDVVLLSQGQAETGGTIVGGDLIIEDIGDADSDPNTESSTDDRITVVMTTDSLGAPAIQISDPNQILGVDFAGVERPDVHTIIVPLGLFDDLIIRTNDGQDVIKVSDLTGFDQSLTIDGGGTDGAVDFIDFSANASGASGESYDLDAEKILFYLDSSISATGGGTIDITSAGGGAEDFVGIQLRRAGLSSEDGSITLVGEGGSSGNNNDGVLLSHGSSITTTGGSVSITGTATSAAGPNDGVSLVGGSDITVGGAGTITITGTSNGASDSYGVQLFTGTELTSAEGDISLTGGGNGTGARNSGIYTNGATVTTTGAGSISLDGEGSGGGTNSKGLRLTGSTLEAAGTGGITLTGTGGGGTSTNVGVEVGVRTSLTTASGDVTITGEGAGSATRNAGVSFLSRSSVDSGGGITVTGTGGDGTSHNDGVSLVSATLDAGGDISVTGVGAGSGNYNRGIDSTRSSFGGGEVTLTGTGTQNGGGSARFGDGVYLNRGGATAAGTLTIGATGGTGSSNNRGLYASGVTLGGTLAVTGTADAGTTGSGNSGVYIQNSTLGAGTILGTAGGGTGSFGAYMQNITGGIAPGDVTTGPDDDEEKGGNFFNVLPALLLAAGADKAARRRNRQLAGLLASLETGQLSENEVAIYREEDGHIGLEATVVSVEALAASGVEVPEAPEGSRRVLLLTGGNLDPANGIFATVDATGELVGTEGIDGFGRKTLGSMLEQLGGENPAWSKPSERTRSAGVDGTWGEVFGLEK